MSEGPPSEGVETLGPLDIRGVLAALPHRYPMLLIDRVVSIVPRTSIHAVIAQAAGVLAVHSLGLAGSGKLVYFMGIENAKFRSPVEPGCLVDFHVEFTQLRGAVCKFTGKAMVDGKLAAEASCTAMIADPPKD